MFTRDAPRIILNIGCVYCVYTKLTRGFVNYPNHNFGHQPNPNPDPYPNPNPSRQERNIRLTGWSRDQISFLPITSSSQGSIFTLRHVGWFGISEQKCVDSRIFRTFRPKIFENLGERFSESGWHLLSLLISMLMPLVYVRYSHIAKNEKN